MDWFNKTAQNVILLISLGGSLIGAVYFFIKDKLREWKTDSKLKAMEKDVEIANEAPKRGSDLIDRL